jgi:hypothetical protein
VNNTLNNNEVIRTVNAFLDRYGSQFAQPQATLPEMPGTRDEVRLRVNQR